MNRHIYILPYISALVHNFLFSNEMFLILVTFKLIHHEESTPDFLVFGEMRNVSSTWFQFFSLKSGFMYS